ncbi:sensor histidine kinase [Aliterella atlantica]|uniref:sensor histidine kinase n=1 Tax=Aliterella atlantica TaxID=1827278 RepID=UPI0005D44A05|nr:ATP-binding protein [Aliterella atlantica]
MRLLASLASHLNPSRSLRTRLGLAIAGTAIILSVVASLIVGHTASEQVKVNVGQSLTELAYQMTDKLDRGMFERYRDLQIISTLNAIRSPDTPILEQRNLLEKLQSTYPDYAWIGFTDTRGVVRASTRKLLEGKNVKARPWFVAGKKAAYVGDVHEAVKLAKLLPNPTGEPLRFVDVAVPVRDLQGSFRGVLGAHLSWTWAKEVENSLLYPLQERNLQMFVFRQNGELLLSPSGLTTQLTARNLLASLSSYPQKTNGYAVETWSDANTYLTGFARSQGYRDYPGLGWIVLVRQKTETAFTPVQRLQKQIFSWNLIFGGLFAAIAYLAADRITKPILAIASSAETIRQGDTALKIPIVRGKDETARLSQSLHRLVSTLTQQEGALKNSNQQLQQKLSEIQQVEERYRQLAEALPQFIWTLDASGQVEYINQQWTAYTGLTLAQTVLHAWDVVHPDDFHYIRQVWLEAYANSISFESQYRYRGVDNTYRWYLVRGLPLKDEQGKVVKWLGTATDIDKQKQWEVERDRLLQQEKAARANAESANRVKDEFLTILSHELRTPLNPILGWVKLLQKGKLDEFKTAEALVTIERNAKLQLELIEDLLSVSQILQGKLNLKITSVDLQSIVLAAIETVRLAAEAKQIEIVKDFVVASKVTGDPAHLQQVFWNLISNAIKFTPENGRVEVQIVEVGDYAQIHISDTGKGINPDFIPYIFDYFRQEDSTITRKYGGLGLGLAIARNLVELHGGTISATSLGDGKGATFTVKLLVEGNSNNSRIRAFAHS